jgi:RHS repeat-associated protein
MRDHLGNNRIVVAINGNSHQAVQATDYDPFGMPFSNGVNPERQPYKFGGKEYDEMHGLNWYDFGARAYDGILGRFPTTMDPLAEKYYSVSPYAYCLNNPVRFVDPTGEDYWSTNDPDQIRAFINALGSGATQFDFSSGWNHMTDGEFADRLSYNDETQKFYISYGTVENGEVVIVGRSFDANITPVSSSGEGYPGAFIYKPRTGFPGLIERLDSSLNPYSSPHNSYDDGTNTWSVNSSGRITGIAPPTPIMGYPPMVGKGKISTKGMPHGDAGRALSQAERRIAELEKQLQTATGKDKKAIQQTIKNIRETAQKKAKGETHWRK